MARGLLQRGPDEAGPSAPGGSTPSPDCRAPHSHWGGATRSWGPQHMGMLTQAVFAEEQCPLPLELPNCFVQGFPTRTLLGPYAPGQPESGTQVSLGHLVWGCSQDLGLGAPRAWEAPVGGFWVRLGQAARPASRGCDLCAHAGPLLRRHLGCV